MGQNGGGGGGGGAPKKKGGAFKWLAIGCLIVLLAGGGCIVGLYMIGTGAGTALYKDAVTALQKQTVIVEKLGEPLTFGSVSSVNIQNGKAVVQFPVTGGKGEKGTVTLTGSRATGEWRIETMTVTIEKTKEVITVIGPETSAPKKK